MKDALEPISRTLFLYLKFPSGSSVKKKKKAFLLSLLDSLFSGAVIALIYFIFSIALNIGSEWYYYPTVWIIFSAINIPYNYIKYKRYVAILEAKKNGGNNIL
jgi:hypothetical protein